MPTTVVIDTPNQALDPLVLSTTEDTYTITFQGSASSLYTAFIQLRADGDWWYSHKAGGPYFPVYAREALKLDNLPSGKIIYVKAVSGTPTLRGIETMGRAPAVVTNN
jgi:hypothetical protein